MNEPPHFFFIVIFYNTKFRTWAFSLAIVKILAFTILKHYFYSLNTLFYNMLNIKASFFFTTSFKYYFFYNFLFLFCFYFFHPLSLVSLSLSLPLSLTVSPSLLLGLIVSTQQSNPPPAPSYHNSNDHHNDQRPTLIKSMTHANETDQVNDPRQSTWRSTPVTSMIHERRPMNPKPWTQTHEPKAMNPDPRT